MSDPLFDRYAVVDWSSASAPARGADSVWIATLDRRSGARTLDNPSTRTDAIERLVALILGAPAARWLVGFDFPFGYPAGVAARTFGGGDWRAVWSRLAAEIEDGPTNANNRFDVAGRLNAAWPGDGPFWGNGLKRDVDGLPRKKPCREPGETGERPAEWRLVERRRRARGGLGGAPKSVWQLAGAGAVGAQTLVGIVALDRLRADRRIRDEVEIWPFETGLAPPSRRICVAEVYPSIIAPERIGDEPKDAAQVRGLADHFAAADAAGRLAAAFEGPADLDDDARDAIVSEEAWILDPDDV